MSLTCFFLLRNGHFSWRLSGYLKKKLIIFCKSLRNLDYSISPFIWSFKQPSYDDRELEIYRLSWIFLCIFWIISVISLNLFTSCDFQCKYVSNTKVYNSNEKWNLKGTVRKLTTFSLVQLFVFSTFEEASTQSLYGIDWWNIFKLKKK